MFMVVLWVVSVAKKVLFMKIKKLQKCFYSMKKIQHPCMKLYKNRSTNCGRIKLRMVINGLQGSTNL